VPSWKLRASPQIAVFSILCLADIAAVAQMQAPVAPPRGAALTRSIEGAVLSKDGAIVPGAVVLLKDTKTLQVRSYITQADGRYHFFGLSTDINYELRAQANGITSPTKTVSVFDSHRLVKLDLKLKKPMKQ
jgi:hypothetical protein